VSADVLRRVCVHGHFYQPPREDPWRETVEREPSADPYHDWNERVTAECYAPNAAAKILGDDGLVDRIVNNYAWISFDVGPTLMSWLERERRHVYEAILEADRESLGRFDGHGGAVAQAYSHLILPLANSRDMRTQVVWGVRDFERRFDRRPEGMWLPETAVDEETLEVLASEGLRFTLLAPHQARRVRRLTGGEWREVAGGAIDPTVPYLVRLPRGGEIAVFFYDAAISHDIAFGGLLASGEAFAQRLVGAFRPERDGPQLVHVATDGESYGHHHRFGEMGLAYALGLLRRSARAQLTTYGAFLERFPPAEEVEIAGNTSWSCPHGVERWRADCGCKTGGESRWSQAWRRPLREALDSLSDRLSAFYEQAGGAVFRDPWAARNAAIDLVADPSRENQEKFFSEQGLPPFDGAKLARALALVEMERQAMLMLTSCGWFFSDLAGVETIQDLRHAARAIDLAETLGERGIEEGFLLDLARARSNQAEEGNGRQIYERHVRPHRCGAAEVTGATAMAALLGGEGRTVSVAHEVDLRVVTDEGAGRGHSQTGTASVRARRTGETRTFRFLSLDGGFGHLEASVAEEGEEALGTGDDTREGWTRRPSLLTPETLPPDLHRSFLSLAAAATEADLRARIEETNGDLEALVARLSEMGEPVPAGMRSVASAVTTWRISEALASGSDASRAGDLIRAARGRGLPADSLELRQQAVEALAERGSAWAEAPLEPSRLRSFLTMAEVVLEAFPEVDRSRAQWLYQTAVERTVAGECGHLDDVTWTSIVDLGRALGMRAPIR
jgi:alpha-amylase/alpha-mannosidase (GH57 family)